MKKLITIFFLYSASIGRERQRNKWSNFTFGKPLQGEGIEQCSLKKCFVCNTALWRDSFIVHVKVVF